MWEASGAYAVIRTNPAARDMVGWIAVETRLAAACDSLVVTRGRTQTVTLSSVAWTTLILPLKMSATTPGDGPASRNA